MINQKIAKLTFLYALTSIALITGCEDEENTPSTNGPVITLGGDESTPSGGEMNAGGMATGGIMGGAEVMGGMDSGGEMMNMGGMDSTLTRCQSVCDTVLACSAFSECTEAAQNDAASSCQLLCQGTQATQVIALADSTCADSFEAAKSLFGVSDSCTADLCTEQICGDGFACDPASGRCVDACELLDCGSDSCVDGACVDLCENISAARASLSCAAALCDGGLSLWRSGPP